MTVPIHIYSNLEKKSMTVPIHIYSNLEKNEHDCAHPYLQQFRKEWSMSPSISTAIWSMTVPIHIYSNLEKNGA